MIYEFIDQLVRDDGVKSGAEVHKLHPHIAIWFLQMCQGAVLTVSSVVGKLVWVQVWWNDAPDV